MEQVTRQLSNALIEALVESRYWAMLPEAFEALMLGSHDAAYKSETDAAGGYLSMDGVAVVPMQGVITGRMLKGFGAGFTKAMNDPAINRIVLDVNSPGGSVAGVDEMASMISAAKKDKPCCASINSLCASAAYWLASSASDVSVTPSGEVGSIGVFATHADVSRMLANMGIDISLIYAGAHKTEGNQFQPLSDLARAEIQKGVDHYHQMFTDTVGRGRGVSGDKVRADYGQGRVLNAKDALAAGMVDRVETLQSAVKRSRDLAATASGSGMSKGGRKPCALKYDLDLIALKMLEG